MELTKERETAYYADKDIDCVCVKQTNYHRDDKEMWLMVFFVFHQRVFYFIDNFLFAMCVCFFGVLARLFVCFKRPIRQSNVAHFQPSHRNFRRFMPPKR